ncbi:uncharacterized protein PFL1_03888 [Pseudozyma flocculosa PF-1]|nr:uncharacterized protein PFL1_03888 [Pseudozyma flocculosa PF-1]EPQ28584.1 hypothetical protein PFL1_03888 [Pseudozyma flocculosa PF-1]
MDDLYSLMRALISGRITKHMRVKTSSGLHQIGTFLAGDGSPPEGGSGNDGMPGGSGNDGT